MFKGATYQRRDGASKVGYYCRTPFDPSCRLTHRAGFSYGFLLGCQIAAYYRDANLVDDGTRTVDKMMCALCEIPLAFHPEEDWRHSVATDVLANVIERATGERTDVLLKKHVIETLGMSETTYCLRDDQISRLMSLYGN